MSYDCIDGSGVAHQDSASIAAGESWTTDPVIPLGSTCTVTEGDLPDVAPRNVWGPVTFDAVLDVAGQLTEAPAQITRDAQSHSFVVPAAEDNEVVHVTVTNRLIRAEAGYLVAKASDPPSGTMLEPGDTVTYTVTVTPTGPGSTDSVVVTDDLSQVTPYADVTLGAASQGTATLAGDTLTWNVGTVSGTTPLTLTYTATVKAGAYGATLRNHVTATGETAPTACEPCETQHPVTPAVDAGEGLEPAQRVHRADRHRHQVLAEGHQPVQPRAPSRRNGRHRRPLPGAEPRQLRRVRRRLRGNRGPVRQHADLDAAQGAAGHDGGAQVHRARRPGSLRRAPPQRRHRERSDGAVLGLHRDIRRAAARSSPTSEPPARPRPHTRRPRRERCPAPTDDPTTATGTAAGHCPTPGQHRSSAGSHWPERSCWSAASPWSSGPGGAAPDGSGHTRARITIGGSRLSRGTSSGRAPGRTRPPTPPR